MRNIVKGTLVILLAIGLNFLTYKLISTNKINPQIIENFETALLCFPDGIPENVKIYYSNIRWNPIRKSEWERVFGNKKIEFVIPLN